MVRSMMSSALLALVVSGCVLFEHPVEGRREANAAMLKLLGVWRSGDVGGTVAVARIQRKQGSGFQALYSEEPAGGQVRSHARSRRETLEIVPFLVGRDLFVCVTGRRSDHGRKQIWAIFKCVREDGGKVRLLAMRFEAVAKAVSSGRLAGTTTPGGWGFLSYTVPGVRVTSKPEQVQEFLAGSSKGDQLFSELLVFERMREAKVGSKPKVDSKPVED